ncbi:MAG TPA: VOC family protein [Solirubrobacteraceae bacterium]|nr:VOC family protein [Solirubrobacteraceae bacterium]
MSPATAGISTLRLVCLATPDQDRAIAFYENVLGFEKRTDTPFGGCGGWG